MPARFLQVCVPSLAAVSLGLLAGCGSGDPNPPTPPPPSTAAAPAPPSPIARPPAAAPPASSPRPKPSSRKTVSAARRPVEQDPALYALGTAPANFLATRTEFPHGQQRTNVILPAEGVTSSSFVARLPRETPAPVTNPPFAFPENFQPVADKGVGEAGMPLRIRCSVDDSEMALVPGGGFIQGVDSQAPEASPAHAVYVDTFYMDLYEVTVGQYKRFRQANSEKRPQPCLNEADPPDMPALGVSWRDALFYARWVGKELPTESEWEKAARGESSFLHPWGNSRAVWAERRRPGQVDPVGSFPNDRSVYGIYDLAGNAREWTADWYAVDAYASAKTPDGSPVRNPVGPPRPSTPNERVVKGAGDAGWNVWARSGLSMRETQPGVGFRLVLRTPLPEADAPAENQ